MGHAAADLVSIGLQQAVPFRQAHLGQLFFGYQANCCFLFQVLLLAYLIDFILQVDADQPENLFPQGKHRVDAGLGILEYHGDGSAPHATEFTVGKFEQICPIKGDAAGALTGKLGDQIKQ